MRGKLKRLVKLMFVIIAGLTCTAGNAAAAEDPPAQAGPIDFHVVPAIGAGVFVEDSDAESSVTNNGYFLVRIPAFVFPQLNDASAGVQVELSNAPRLRGVDYSVLSYARVRLTRSAYAGANVRLFHGAWKTGAEFSPHATPVVGLRLLSIAGRVPVFLEAELFGDRRPVKAALILTWK